MSAKGKYVLNGALFFNSLMEKITTGISHQQISTNPKFRLQLFQYPGFEWRFNFGYIGQFRKRKAPAGFA